MTALVIPLRTRPFETDVSTPFAGDDGRRLGKRLEELVSEADQHVRDTAIDWRPYLNSAISQMHVECSAPGWDGPGSVPVNDIVLRRTFRVADLLYSCVRPGTPPPDLIPVADGEVTLSWALDADRLFSISVGNHGMLNYAGRLDNGAEPHDAVPFDTTDRTAIQRLAAFIEQLYP